MLSILASQSVSQEDPRLTPVVPTLYRPYVNAAGDFSHGVLSDDGATLHWKGARLDLATGRWTDQGNSLWVGLGKLPKVFAWAMWQGQAAVGGPFVLANAQGESMVGPALDANHLLAANDAIGIRVNAGYLIPVTEFDLPKRGPGPNRSWLIAAPSPFPLGPRASLLALRYADANTVEAWVREPQGRGSALARYVGARGGRGSSWMRLASREPLAKGWDTDASGFAPAYDPFARAFLQHLPGDPGRWRLMDAKNHVVSELPGWDPKARWPYWIRGAEIPQSKAAWEPLAFSGNRKFGQLRRKADGRSFVLRRNP